MLWDACTGKVTNRLHGHSDLILTLVWSGDGSTLASGSIDKTVQIWNPGTGWQKETLLGHTAPLTSLAFSCDSRLLASKATDSTVRLWRSDTWEGVVILAEPTSNVLAPSPTLAFHPSEPVLATLGEQHKVLRIWLLAVSLLGPATLEEFQALAYNNLALCLWKSGKKLEAPESMKKALALNPSSPLIQQNIEVLQSGCFVVTAATGSYSHPFVVELTQFRDDMLCKSASGRWLIRVYYSVGPCIAGLIRGYKLSRAMALWLIVVPGVGLARAWRQLMRP